MGIFNINLTISEGGDCISLIVTEPIVLEGTHIEAPLWNNKKSEQFLTVLLIQRKIRTIPYCSVRFGTSDTMRDGALKTKNVLIKNDCVFYKNEEVQGYGMACSTFCHPWCWTVFLSCVFCRACFVVRVLSRVFCRACFCRACFVVFLSWFCHVLVVFSSWFCHVLVVFLSWLCHVFVVFLSCFLPSPLHPHTTVTRWCFVATLSGRGLLHITEYKHHTYSKYNFAYSTHVYLKYDICEGYHIYI